MEKRGLSPIIATVLLISITLLVAVMIFSFFKSFVGEAVTKFDEPIENACDEINFDAEVFKSGVSSEVSVVNRGNVPIYGIEIRKKELGSIKEFKSFDNTIDSGESWSESVSGLNLNDEVIILPTILGEIDGDTKAFTCDDNFGVVTSVV